MFYSRPHLHFKLHQPMKSSSVLGSKLETAKDALKELLADGRLIALEDDLIITQPIVE